MNQALPPVCQSPDDLMAIPISDLVYKLDLRVRRAVRWINLARAESDPEMLKAVRGCMKREDALLHAAATALRARADEASRYAARIGLDCPPEFPRKSPHLAACAFVKHVMGADYGRDE